MLTKEDLVSIREIVREETSLSIDEKVPGIVFDIILDTVPKMIYSAIDERVSQIVDEAIYEKISPMMDDKIYQSEARMTKLFIDISKIQHDELKTDIESNFKVEIGKIWEELRALKAYNEVAYS